MFKKYFKKADIVLFIVLLAIGLGGMFLLRKSPSENAMVEISVDGKLVKSMPLSQDKTESIKSDYGYNIICIENRQVSISDADCPNKDCMRFGKISHEGDIILCLPHRLSVRITGAKGGNDAISY